MTSANMATRVATLRNTIRIPGGRPKPPALDSEGGPGLAVAALTPIVEDAASTASSPVASPRVSPTSSPKASPGHAVRRIRSKPPPPPPEPSTTVPALPRSGGSSITGKFAGFTGKHVAGLGSRTGGAASAAVAGSGLGAGGASGAAAGFHRPAATPSSTPTVVYANPLAAAMASKRQQKPGPPPREEDATTAAPQMRLGLGGGAKFGAGADKARKR